VERPSSQEKQGRADSSYVATAPRYLPALLAAAVLAGCGAGEREAASVAGTRAAAAPVDATPTDGRTGDATTAASDSRLARLSRGGRVAPGAVKARPRRDGVGAGAACGNVDVIPTADTVAAVEDAVLCLLNGERADRGLAQLAENAQLAQAALGHATDMVQRDYFSHDSPDGATMTDRIAATGYLPDDASWLVGENLAWGTGSLATARAIMDAWMSSEGHRANILNPRFREIGMGTALGTPQGGDSGATYAHEFGVRGEEDSAVLPASAGSAPAPRAIPSRRALARERRACRRLGRPKRVRACRAKVARRARAARLAQRQRKQR